MKCVSAVSVSILAVLAVTPAAADPAHPLTTASLRAPFMKVYGSSQAPYGYVRYCEQSPASCTAKGPGVRFEATPERLSDLDEVNRLVNRSVTPATDSEIYGISEYWTLPGTKGDCEDYALLKQKVLISRGWPSSSLLLTVVRDEKGEGHAVLTARTSQGDFILDNKVDDVRLWSHSSYQFVMRQSYLDPKVWVSLDPQDGRIAGSLAGVKED
ncbi:MAG: transglutaminase-like cysteine peptidase [Hyphomicrobium sp.]|nr:transglutaminase-like cysteine peptidase [Hyphomicrobium sp.]